MVVCLLLFLWWLFWGILVGLVFEYGVVLGGYWGGVIMKLLC